MINYPGRFQDIGHARAWCEKYVYWYNVEHHHSNLAGFTAEQVFSGRVESIAKVKQQTLDAQFLLHPERFVKGLPKVGMPDKDVYINPIIAENGEIELGTAVNFPTLKRAKRT